MSNADLMSNPHGLVFGGNGRVARAMTKLMVSRSWQVTSVVRNLHRHEKDILRLAASDQADRLSVINCNLQTIRTSDDALQLLEKVRPSCVVFAAGSFSDPYKIDRDVAQRIIKAASHADYVRKFLIISFPASRRQPAPWWNQKDIRQYIAESESYPDIKDAKLQADEYLVAAARQRELLGGPRLQAISLRPSWLLTSSATGRVKLGRTQAVGKVTIGDVASVAVEMLGRDDVGGWFDLVEGREGVERAVDRVVSEGIDCIEGGDLERIYGIALD
ncbi:NAD(P)-binding protein [Aspergillus ellipticus CBS 707.79]|uniref:NAD(P)-binding protein n=1 Tax=Aspergillus ellipticus CBS 707.79 TaxID=1448320 RepID=A0A319F4R0_9EURO|nr:NAD(P)-binding protein [Aspergillus ellipticus CBS 707.79]